MLPMSFQKNTAFWVLGMFILLGLSSLGYLLGDAAIRVKEYERTVTVKGLSEREYPADIVIWPIRFTEAGNDLAALYGRMEQSAGQIIDYLVAMGVDAAAISVSVPQITDRSAQAWGANEQVAFRFVSTQAVTVYSNDVPVVREAMQGLVELGKQGIVLSGDPYQDSVEYLFSGLNEAKPGMIEEATTRAREVGMKFADDSNSRLGKIRKATQGQFSIQPRDTNNPHIKTVRVVSTVEYYLAD